MYMASWAAQQRMKYIIGFLFILGLVSAFPIYSVIHSLTHREPTCFDGIQNQNETGVDCGGLCELACVDSLNDLQILWTRIFELDTDTYDLAALVENPNRLAGVRDISYTFTVLDDAGEVVYTREGFEYINPREKLVVYEPNIFIEDAIPSKVVFTFDDNPRWVQMRETRLPIVVKERVLINEKTRPRINATIENTDLIEGYRELDIVALVSDARENVIAASATYVEEIDRDEQRSIFLTWPTPFKGEAAERACLPGEQVTGGYIDPTDIMLVFDRSGSMNDDGPSPPQPLTNAKLAAQSFVDALKFEDQIGLVSFATEASTPIDQELTSSVQRIKEEIGDVFIGKPDGEQHTNLGSAIQAATEELLSGRRNDSAQSAMVVLTDGIATRPLNPDDPGDEEYAEEYAAQEATIAHEEDISVYVIGLGNSINEDFLATQIASSEAHFYKAALSEDLMEIYADIATAVCREYIYTVDFFIRTRQ